MRSRAALQRPLTQVSTHPLPPPPQARPRCSRWTSRTQRNHRSECGPDGTPQPAASRQATAAAAAPGRTRHKSRTATPCCRRLLNVVTDLGEQVLILGDAALAAGAQEARFAGGARVSLQGVFLSRGAGSVRVVSGHPIARAQYCFAGNNISALTPSRSLARGAAAQTVTCEWSGGSGAMRSGTGTANYRLCAPLRRRSLQHCLCQIGFASQGPRVPPSSAAARVLSCRWSRTAADRHSTAGTSGSIRHRAGAAWGALCRCVCCRRAAASGRSGCAHCVCSLGGAGA